MFSPLEEHVSSKCRAFNCEGPLGVAVSGGGDSLALCFILKQLNIPFIGFHFNHNLRKESAEEALWLAGLFKKWQTPLKIGVWQKTGMQSNVQAQAREARYTFFKDASKNSGVACILTAHTANDIAETVLMRLFYGSGPQGLQQMPEKRPLGEELTLYRPLLEVNRSELREYLASYNQTWLEDPSNYKAKYVRVRARFWLNEMPLLQNEFLAFSKNCQKLERALEKFKMPELIITEQGAHFSIELFAMPRFLYQRFLYKAIRSLRMGHPPRPQQLVRLVMHLKQSEKAYELGHLQWQAVGGNVYIKKIQKA